MTPTIINRIVGGSPELALQLANSQIGRSISIPAGWSKLRIGVRWHCTTSGVSILTTPILAIGLGHGTTNMIADATCDHFAGMMINNDATWTFAANRYTVDINCVRPTTKVGTTLTHGTAMNAAHALQLLNLAESGTADRTLFFLDISTGAPNYTFQTFQYAATSTIDRSAAQFLAQMVLDPPTDPNHNLTTARTLAVDEVTNGALNAVQLWWNRTEVRIEICDLAVALLA